MSEAEFETRAFTKEDFEKPETEIEKWILGDVIQALNMMEEQYLIHLSEGDDVEAAKYRRGIVRLLHLDKTASVSPLASVGGVCHKDQ